MTEDAYLSQLQALLPPGAAWTREPDAVLTRLLAALACELARVDGRADVLLAECDPRLAIELITDWERVAGLPDTCTGPLATLDERRAAVHARITSAGGQSRAYFIGLAAAVGYAVTITEFRPWTCEDPCDGPIYDDTWAHTWRVDAPETSIRVATCESPVDEPLRSWGNTLLECVVSRFAPAHTVLHFGYAAAVDTIIGDEAGSPITDESGETLFSEEG